MTLRLAPARAGGETDRVDRALVSFATDWTGGEPDLEQYWSRLGPDGSVTELAALVKIDLRCRFEGGSCPSVSGYLERFPELRAEKDRVLSLIYEEFCLREECGERLGPEEFCDRYPSWRDSLASQLRYHELLSRVVSPTAATTRFPEPGERFQEFRLDALLGKGGAAHVYLARDESLGGREVALKVSPDRGNEPAIMGRLDHAHIVNVLSVAYDSETGLRGLCMPYRPGLPLDEIIRRVNPAATRPRSARALWDALSPVGSVAPALPGGDSSWASFPLRGSYAEAVAWVIAVLARALAHAHGLGIMHRDVKPANVLLTVRDGPQLLDFNLAHDPHSADQAEAALRGGTLPYMAPEQLQAFFDPERWGEVGASADLYSLGLVLRELLTGQAPEAPDPKLPLPRALRSLLDRRADFRLGLRAHAPATPRALEAITDRCLAFAPADRYLHAEALVEDLECFLARRPLRYAVNPSRHERAANWSRRNRSILGAFALFLGLLGVAFLPAQIRKWTPAEQSPAFWTAVENVEHGRISEALPVLERVVNEYRESTLARLYLSLALDQNGEVNQAAKQFTKATKALDAPQAEEGFLNWGRDRPNLAQLFTGLGRGLERARDSEPANPEENQNLALRAFEIALRLDPEAEYAREAAAYAYSQGRRKKYADALELLFPLIRKAEARNTPKDRAKLVRWYPMDARIAIHAGNDLWRTHPDIAPTQARSYYDQAIDDLDRAEKWLQRHDRQGHYDVDYLRVKALIALGDLDQRLHDDEAAIATYHEAAKAFQRIEPRAADEQACKVLDQDLRDRLVADLQ